ncbi:hypothetical protein BD749_0032 [Pontibacter ramchanderi]|uniref:Uncharacterized protein n=1 Tax=Pontibacter ramchanderi TaxID=1179743 RepID=A0A2N3V0F4_9BACT|nr:hypothetical protein BD749_0032 [Pontibacter ramchanderi]
MTKSTILLACSYAMAFTKIQNHFTSKMTNVILWFMGNA